MGELEYSSSKTTALVKFQAHKFPYTRSELPILRKILLRLYFLTMF